MSRMSATRRGERTTVSQDFVRDCDQAMRSFDAQATQPVGDTAPEAANLQTHAVGIALEKEIVEEEGTCSRSAAWQRRVRVPPPLRVGRPSPGRPETARRVRQRIGAVMKWEVAMGYRWTTRRATSWGRRPGGSGSSFNTCGRYHGRRPSILARRERIKQRTLQQRRQENLRTPHPAAQRREVSLV